MHLIEPAGRFYIAHLCPMGADGIYTIMWVTLLTAIIWEQEVTQLSTWE